ncbi:MAG: SCO family protein [Alphaproteobacteria bacterium]|nr:SCO family protein [Alphaproteobacteria bacterium]
MAYSQDAIGRHVGDASFVDSDGKARRLADFAGKPVLVSLIYTSCHHTCPLITHSLARAVDAADQAFGADAYTVLTVGFDVANDKPERMRAYARSNGVGRKGWHFLSTDKENVGRLAADLGFLFEPSPRGFEHLTQTSILTADLRVYRQVYGDDFKASAIGDPLKGLLFGAKVDFTRGATLWDRIKLICTVYDPNIDRYRFSYAIFIGLGIGFLSLAGVGYFLARSWWRIRTTRTT